MPSISKKGQHMPSSPIRALVPYATKAKKEGKKVIHLNIGQPDVKTPDAVMQALRGIDFDVLAYINSEGREPFRRKWAEFYKTLHVDIDYTDLVVTTGGSEALLYAMLTCLDPGDEIIIPEPFYANYNGFAQAGNIVIKPISSKIEDGFALPPISEFEKLIGPKTKAILICNPNNPTGYLYSKEELKRIKEIVLKHDLFLFSDEVYRDFSYTGNHTCILSLGGLDDHAIVFDSISKRYSACGARLGCLISKNKEIVSTAIKFTQSRLSPPTLGEIAGLAGFDVPEQYFEDVRSEYIERRDTLVNGLNSIEGVFCPSPGGAFYVMAKLPVKNVAHFCQWILEDFDLDGWTVMMAPGAGFYASQGRGLDEVRMAYVLNKETLHTAVSCIRKALEVYPG